MDYLPDLGPYSNFTLLFILAMTAFKVIEKILEARFEFLRPKASMNGLDKKLRDSIDELKLLGATELTKIKQIFDDIEVVKGDVEKIWNCVEQHGTRLTKLETEHHLYHRGIKIIDHLHE